jgi:hypothetical protein
MFCHRTRRFAKHYCNKIGREYLPTTLMLNLFSMGGKGEELRFTLLNNLSGDKFTLNKTAHNNILCLRGLKQTLGWTWSRKWIVRHGQVGGAWPYLFLANTHFGRCFFLL